MSSTFVESPFGKEINIQVRLAFLQTINDDIKRHDCIVQVPVTSVLVNKRIITCKCCLAMLKEKERKEAKLEKKKGWKRSYDKNLRREKNLINKS